jgi:hypothetical protein
LWNENVEILAYVGVQAVLQHNTQRKTPDFLNMSFMNLGIYTGNMRVYGD